MVWWGVVFTATEWMFVSSILSILIDLAGAQTPLAANSNSLLVGKAAYGDWRVRCSWNTPVHKVVRPTGALRLWLHRKLCFGCCRPADAQLSVPLGFRLSFASGLNEPSLIRVAPNGDIFIAESRAGRIRVLRPSDGGDEVIRNAIFASGLRLPFGIAFYPSGNEPQWIYVANTDSVVRFRYRNGDLHADEEPEVIVPTLPEGGHWTRDIAFSLDDTEMFISVGSLSNDAELTSTFNAASPRQWIAFLRQQIIMYCTTPGRERTRRCSCVKSER